MHSYYCFYNNREDVCVLSAVGTATIINLQCGDVNIESNSISKHQSVIGNKEIIRSSLDDQDFQKDMNAASDISTSMKCLDSSEIQKSHELDVNLSNTINEHKTHRESSEIATKTIQLSNNCTVCHIPYKQSSVPFRVNMMKCSICR